VQSQIVTHAPAVRTYRDSRTRIVSALGPSTSVGGVLWAIVQPYRVTLLHPHHQGVWWLIAEPPLLVIAAGIMFSLLIARPLLADLQGDHGAA